MRPPRVLTWHVHGSYLYYLAHARAQFYLPVRPGRPEGYGGRTPSFPWPENVVEVPAEEVARLSIDCVLYQSARNYLFDQHEILSPSQLRLPRLYLEHDPPRQDPVNTRHPVDDPAVLLVHVTPFNQLMWDSGRTPTTVIEHGVPDLGHRYSGDTPRGLAVVNNLPARGRRLGVDVLERFCREIPVDLVGMGSEGAGGLGEVHPRELAAFAARYRFFFNPIRYTSLGLAVCEAMMLGLPVLGLATTEMASAVENGVSGYVDTRLEVLTDRARDLLRNPLEARRLGEGARRRARERFGLDRFTGDWERALALVTGLASTRSGSPVAGVPA
ncbi:MAG: glycosyltransferase [Dehalococcoidia bacterium]|nr:glycosyltransferase [Dehalococcoidia bacterium]